MLLGPPMSGPSFSTHAFWSVNVTSANVIPRNFDGPSLSGPSISAPPNIFVALCVLSDYRQYLPEGQLCPYAIVFTHGPIFGFLRASAMLKHVIAIGLTSVRPSVRLSVRHTLAPYQNG